jgi:hypothetical protein
MSCRFCRRCSQSIHRFQEPCSSAGAFSGAVRGPRLDLRLVLLLQRLDALLHVAAGVEQVLIGFVELVLVQIQLRLGEIELVLDRALLRFLGLRELGGKRGHPLLVGVEQRLRLADALLDRAGLGAQLRRVRLDVAQGRGERKRQCMVGHAQRSLRVGLLLGRVGQPGQPFRGVVGALIDDLGGGEVGGPLPADLGGGRGGPPPREAGGEQ